MKNRCSTATHLLMVFLVVTPAVFSQNAKRQSRQSVSFVAWRKYFLAKPIGRVDQLVSLPDGGFLVRDSNYPEEATQAIEEYDSAGHFVRKIGDFGHGPSQYFRLTSVHFTGGDIWASDVAGKIIKYSLSGKFLGTILIQNPGYQLTDLVIDQNHSMFYLAGCLPLHTYLDLGCSLVHQYGLINDRYVRSFLETDPEAIQRGLLPFESYFLDVDQNGRIVMADRPLFKVFVVDPVAGKTAEFPVHSRIGAPPAKISGNSNDAMRDAYNNAYLIDRVLTIGPYTVVSIRKPFDKGYLVEVLDSGGKQVATDVRLPGRIVGRSPGGDIYMASQKNKGFQIELYKLRRKQSAGAHSH